MYFSIKNIQKKNKSELRITAALVQSKVAHPPGFHSFYWTISKQYLVMAKMCT